MCVLAAKALLAVMLLVAGGAKLADLPGFAAAVRLLVPLRAPRAAFRAAAAAIALTELALGAASLSLPGLAWLNLAVLALACGFLTVSIAGYALRRGRSCRCFGALSNRKFDAAGIARSAVIAAAAGLAAVPLRPDLVAVSASARVLLLVAGALTAVAARSAARALGLASRLEPEG